MANFYTIQYKDVNGAAWKVLIEDIIGQRRPYNAGASLINVGGGSWDVIYTFDRLPDSVTSVTFLTNGSTTVPAPVYSPQQFAVGGSPSGLWGMTLHRAGQPDEVINITDLADIPNEVPLTGATAQPVVIKTINNGDDKFSPIRVKHCIIQFINTGLVGPDTFAGDDVPDDKWRVTVTRDEATIFIGFLSTDDLSEPLQDPVNIVQLVATDGLGKLRDVAIKDFSGEKPGGVRNLITWIAMALATTGLALGIKSCDRTQINTGVNEIYNISISAHKLYIPGKHNQKAPPGTVMKVYLPDTTYTVTVSVADYTPPYPATIFTFTTSVLPDGYYNNVRIDFNLSVKVALDNAGVDARTFSAGLLEMQKTHQVLEKILSPFFYITQLAGYWWLMNINEQASGSLAVKNYAPNATPGATATLANNKSIGRLENMQLTDASAVARMVRPIKYSRVMYKYEGPENSLANENYSEGVYQSTEWDNIPVYKPNTNPPQLVYDTKRRYNLDGWTLKRINTGTGAITAPNTTAFIRRYFAEGVEKYREIVIDQPPAGDKGNYVLENNNAVPVEAGDRVRLAFEWRPENTVLGTLQGLCYVLLQGDSGKVYTLRGGEFTAGQTNKWYDNPTPANPAYPWQLSLGAASPAHSGAWVIVKADYMGLNDSGGAYSDPLPEDGTLIVRLLHYTSASSTLFRSLFQNIKLEIKQYAGQNVLQATGEFNKVQQAGYYAANKDQDIYIDNSPKRTYKGALLVPDGTGTTGYSYDLAGSFFNDVALPGIKGTWGKLAAYSLWRQLSKVQRMVHGSMLLHGTEQPDMTAAYTIEPGSNNAHVAGRVFGLLSYTWDTANARVSDAVFCELLTRSFDDETFESGYTNE